MSTSEQDSSDINVDGNLKTQQQLIERSDELHVEDPSKADEIDTPTSMEVMGTAAGMRQHVSEAYGAGILQQTPLEKSASILSPSNAVPSARNARKGKLGSIRRIFSRFFNGKNNDRGLSCSVLVNPLCVWTDSARECQVRAVKKLDDRSESKPTKNVHQS